jgi:hypothetical protein
MALRGEVSVWSQISVLSLSARATVLLWPGKAAVLLAVFVGIGLSAIWMPLAPLVLLAGIWIGSRGHRLPADALALLIIGNIVLSFGFANLGLRLGGLPIPLTEILLLPLVGIAVLRLRSLQELGWSGVFLTGFLVLATLRLIASLPDWGVLAVRDYTTPLEALAIVVGFWAVKEYGLGKWIGVWQVAFLALLVYASLFPFKEQLASLGPVVGLQRPTPLLGQFAGAATAISSAFFFFQLHSSRNWAYLLGAWALVLLLILQTRSTYFAVPLAALVVAVASRRIGGTVPVRLAAGLGLAILALFLIAPLVPSGRVGAMTPAFYASHISTVIGAEGPSSGTLDDRMEWSRQLWDRLRAQPANMLVGIGPGPDLIGGFRGLEGELVRKPHNDYLEIFARFGIVGAGLWAGLIASALGRIWSGVRRHEMQDEEKRFLIWVLALATVYLLISGVQPLMGFPYGTIPLFAALGMGLAVATRPVPTPAPEPQHLPRFVPGSSQRIVQ